MQAWANEGDDSPSYLADSCWSEACRLSVSGYCGAGEDLPKQTWEGLRLYRQVLGRLQFHVSRRCHDRFRKSFVLEDCLATQGQWSKGNSHCGNCGCELVPARRWEQGELASILGLFLRVY